MSSEPILVGTFISSSQSPIVPAKKDNTALLKKLKLILLLKQLQAKKAAAAKQKAIDLAKAAALAKAASSAELKPVIASSKPAIVSSKPALILTKPALVNVSPTVAGQPVKTVTVQKTGPTNKTVLATALAKVLAKKK
jgi:CCR4-NOT transcriptional regulation complex NOT5 subunit